MKLKRNFVRVLRAAADQYCRIAPMRRGQTRLRVWVGRWLKKTPGLPLEKMTVSNDGRTLPLWVSPSSSLGACVWSIGNFDVPGVTDCMAAMAAEPGGTFLDIGANIGLFSVFVAVQGRGLRVVAVETHPEVLPTLRRNLAENAAEISAAGARVEVVPCALGETDGTADFYANFDDSSSSLHHFGHLQGRTVRVPLRRGDAVVAELGLETIALCKLDVEGGELMVLRGLHDTLRRQRIRRLRMEINLVCCRLVGHTPEDLIALLASHGYRMTAESLERYERKDWSCEDFVFLPNGAAC